MCIFFINGQLSACGFNRNALANFIILHSIFLFVQFQLLFPIFVKFLILYTPCMQNSPPRQ
jgi:hypothetical protein